MSIRGSLRRALLFALCLAPASTAIAALHHPGRWTNPILWKQGSGSDVFEETAVNMALLALPDSAGHTQARVLWFQDDHEHMPGEHTVYGGHWDWREPSDLQLGAGIFPDTSASTGTLRARRFPSPGYNIFCSGMAQLDEDQGFGRLLVAGGTSEAENGSSEARVYNARTNSWEATANGLGVGRWYPTLTTLPTGKVLVTSGSRFRELWLSGGAPGDSLVHRAPIAHEASWLDSLLPAQFVEPAPPRRMGPRRGHTANSSLGGSQIYFGGIDLNSGIPVDQFWQLGVEHNPAGPEYSLAWARRVPAADGPSPRAYHAASIVPGEHSTHGVASFALVGGDVTGAGSADSSVWVGALEPGEWTVNWKRLPLAFDSDPFPARFGHAAYWHDAFSCLFVYGGRPGGGASPNDPWVYSLEMVEGGQTDSVRIKRCALQDGVAPMPRAHFASGLVERRVPINPSNPSAGTLAAQGLFVYGGRTGTGAADISDSLYVLWPLDSVTVRWQLVAQSAMEGSSRPPALEFAAGTGTTNTVEFWVSGGRDASGTARDDVYSFHVHCVPCGPDSLPPHWQELTAEWETRASASHPVWGHAMAMASHETFERTPEVFDPASNAFTHYPSAYRLQDWYPHTFVVPGSGTGTVITTGPATETWKFQASSAIWSPVSSAASPNLRGGSAVMYRPGKVMKCGSRDTDGADKAAVGTTATLDITLASPAWVSSDAMLGRVNHNLTLLPDGKVLVTGGTGHIENSSNTLPRRRPEIWDPDANGGTGAWEGGDGVGVQLDTSLVARGYHSTALLLPDGRVVCAGGNATNHEGEAPANDQFRVDIYSPPYLFNADGSPATRPGLRTAPRRVSYGQPFAVSTGGTAIDSVTGGCLIRAGAATHGYDSGQLYLPLTFVAVTQTDPNRRYFKTTAPTDSAVAPPGDYLLFVRNASGTPSVARWIHIGRTNGSGSVPTTVTDLGRECIDGTAVRLRWTPPGSDLGDTLLFMVQQYDARFDSTSINSVGHFTGLSPVVLNEPWPAGEPLGDPDRLTTHPLVAGQTYYFRLRAKNYAYWNGNWSELSNQFVWTVHDEDCGGSGGGGGGGGYEEEARIRPGSSLYSMFGRPGGGTVPDSAFLDNTLLPNAAPGTTVRDRMRLPHGPRWTEAGARVRLSRSGSRSTRFDRVRLLAADPAPGEAVFVRAGELVGGLTHDPVRIVHADGRDLSEQFLAGGGFEGRDHDTLYVEFGQADAGSVVLSASRAHLVRAPDRTGIDLACEGEQGWVDVGHHDVRERGSEEVFDTPSLRRVRLAFRGVHRLDAVGRFTVGTPVSVTAYEPVAAEHSRLGEVAAAFAADGTTLASGDEVRVDFAATRPGEGTPREWYLEVTGAHVEGTGGVQAAQRQESAAGVPAVFALGRNRPNPFAGSTTIGFDVPARAHVRLEVFDVAGRRVATLADREYEPGRFTVEWSGRTSAGTIARAGVYLCRMTAGTFRREQHLVLVR